MPTEIILGTVQLGLNYGINNSIGKPSLPDAFEILDFAWKNGVRYLDTADAYGDAQSIIGLYQEETQNRFHINSKFTANSISVENQLNKTLGELKSEKLNIYFFHNFKDYKNNPALLNELLVLKQSNRIDKIGLSVYDKEEMRLAIVEPEIDVIQTPYNLLDNSNERGELLVEAKAHNKLIQIRSVFLQGLFLKSPESLPARLSPLKQSLEAIHTIAKNANLTIQELAVSYILEQPLIDEIILGVENVEQLEENLKLLHTNFPNTISNEIDQIKINETELLYPKNWI